MRYRLASLSNIETRTLARTVELLAVPFAALVTVEERGSCKPARAQFDEGLRRLGLPHEGVQHVAQHVPDARAGLARGLGQPARRAARGHGPRLRHA